MRRRTTIAHLGLLALVLGAGACMEDQTGGSYSSLSHWPSTSRVVLPAGTALPIRLESRLNAQIAGPGDSWTGRLVSPVMVNGRALLPAGAFVHGNVIEARRPGRDGGGMLDLHLTSVSLGGQDVPLDASADELMESPRGGSGSLAVTASMDPRTATLVLQPGTRMTFTIEESVAVRCEP